MAKIHIKAIGVYVDDTNHYSSFWFFFIKNNKWKYIVQSCLFVEEFKGLEMINFIWQFLELVHIKFFKNTKSLFCNNADMMYARFIVNGLVQYFGM